MEHISVLLPTRGRPEMLEQVLNCLEDLTVRHDLLHVALYVDYDDQLTLNALDRGLAKKYKFSLRWQIGIRTATSGEMANTLCQTDTFNSSVFFGMCDDYILATAGWDEIIRNSLQKYPDRVMLAYANDPLAPDFGAFPILTKEWIKLTGNYMTEYFPFWFDDTWIDEIARMIQRKEKLPILISPITGKGRTIRMHNLVFWHKFFANTLDERIMVADRLRTAIYQPGSPEYQTSLNIGMEQIELFKRAHAKSVGQLMSYELDMAESKAFVDPAAEYRYYAAESKAITKVLAQLNQAIQLGDEDLMRRLMENLYYAKIRIPSIRPEG